jgi:hypothetical protein
MIFSTSFAFWSSYSGTRAAFKGGTFFSRLIILVTLGSFWSQFADNCFAHKMETVRLLNIWLASNLELDLVYTVE